MLGLLELLFAIAPTYVWRFRILGFPTNFLEIAVGLFWLIFIVYLFSNKEERRYAKFFAFLKTQSRFFTFSMALFLLAAVISTIISPDKSRAIGLFVAYFFEPMITYFLAKFIFEKDPENKRMFVNTILVVIGICSLYGIIQYFTRIGLPSEWWGNSTEPKRVLSVFEYPNAFALYLAPLLALCLPFVFGSNNQTKRRISANIVLFFLGCVGLLLSLSRGGWLAFAASVVLFIIAFYPTTKYERSVKYILSICLVITILIITVVPNLRYRAILPFKGDKSTVSRFSLWHTADTMIKSSPVLGKGLYGFKTDFDKYNTDPNLTSLDYPHNIFLNFWVETGLLGLLSFLLITGYKAYHAIKNRKNIYALGVLLFLVAIYIHGLSDVPYFLNDLALIFWIVLAMI